MADWLKRSHEELCKQSAQTLTYLEGKFGDWGINGKSAEWINTVVKPAYNDNWNAFLAWENQSERTPSKTAALKRTEAVFIPLYRELYKFLTGNPLVLDEDLLKMDMPERRSGKRTAVPVPTTVPLATIKTPSPAVVEIHFKDSGAERKAKPDGVHGVEIAWLKSDTPPSKWSELTNSAFDTKTPYTFTFENNERGERVYFALRWENTRGEKGHWSEIYEAVIP